MYIQSDNSTRNLIQKENSNLEYNLTSGLQGKESINSTHQTNF